MISRIWVPVIRKEVIPSTDNSEVILEEMNLQKNLSDNF
jgi:hypothetical protein